MPQYNLRPLVDKHFDDERQSLLLQIETSKLEVVQIKNKLRVVDMELTKLKNEHAKLKRKLEQHGK